MEQCTGSVQKPASTFGRVVQYDVGKTGEVHMQVVRSFVRSPKESTVLFSRHERSAPCEILPTSNRDPRQSEACSAEVLASVLDVAVICILRSCAPFSVSLPKTHSGQSNKSQRQCANRSMKIAQRMVEIIRKHSPVRMCATSVQPTKCLVSARPTASIEPEKRHCSSA